MMRHIGYVLWGWFLGMLSMLFTRWLQHKEDRQKKEIDIISEVLTYLFKIRESYNNLLSDRLVLEESRKLFPDKASELERNIYARFNNELLKDFFPNLMFHSFQLKRIDDKTFWRDFEGLMSKYEELGNMIMGMAEMGMITKISDDIMSLMKNYTEKCLAKTKV